MFRDMQLIEGIYIPNKFTEALRDLIVRNDFNTMKELFKNGQIKFDSLACLCQPACEEDDSACNLQASITETIFGKNPKLLCKLANEFPTQPITINKPMIIRSGGCGEHHNLAFACVQHEPELFKDIVTHRSTQIINLTEQCNGITIPSELARRGEFALLKELLARDKSQLIDLSAGRRKFELQKLLTTKDPELLTTLIERNKMLAAIKIKPKADPNPIETAKNIAEQNKKIADKVKADLEQAEQEKKLIAEKSDIIVQFTTLLKDFGIAATKTTKDKNEYITFSSDDSEKLNKVQELIKNIRTTQKASFKFSINKDKTFSIYNAKLKSDISKIFTPLKHTLTPIIVEEKRIAEEKNASELATKSSLPTISEDKPELFKDKLPEKPDLIIPFDRAGWKNFLHSAFCYAAEINIQWNEKDKHFIIDLSQVSSQLTLTLEKLKPTLYTISPSILHDQMRSRLDRHLLGMATVVNNNNILIIKPDEKYPEISHKKGDLYANISDYIAAINKKNEPIIKNKSSNAVINNPDAEIKTHEESISKNENPNITIINNITSLMYSITDKKLLANTIQVNVNTKSHKNLLEVIIDKKTSHHHLGQFKNNQLEFFTGFVATANHIVADCMKLFVLPDGNFKIVIDATNPNTLTRLNSADNIATAKNHFNESSKSFTSKKSAVPSVASSRAMEAKEINVPTNLFVPKKPEPDIVNAMINTIKDVSVSPQRRDNLIHHLNVLNTMRPDGSEKDDVNHLIYLLHAFRISLILSKKDKYKDLNYKSRNALRHKFQKQTFDELFETFNPFIEKLQTFVATIQERGSNASFYRIKGDVKEHVTEKVFKCFEEAIKNSGCEEKNFTEDTPEKIAQWKTRIDIITANTAYSATEKRDAVIMLHILIGKNTSEKYTVSGEIYRQTGHEGLNKPYDTFANEMYTLHLDSQEVNNSTIRFV